VTDAAQSAADLTGLPTSIGSTEPDPNASQGEDDPNPEVVALNKRLDDMQNDHKAQAETYQRTIDSLIQGGAGAPTVTPSVVPEPISYDDLPDPVEKRAEFNAELGKRLDAREAKIVANVSAVATQSNQATALWQDFKSEHPEFAKKDALANTIAAQVMQARGGTDWAFSNQETFKDEVAAKMHEELGTKPEDFDATGTRVEADAPKGEMPKVGKANRTAGLGTGSKEKSGVVSEPDKSPGFISQLKQMQMKDGLI